jgi:hypothetical protein
VAGFDQNLLVLCKRGDKVFSWPLKAFGKKHSSGFRQAWLVKDLKGLLRQNFWP